MGSHLRLTALAAAAVACLAYWCTRPAPDWALARELLRECRRAEALERRGERARRANADKAAVTAEALAGRLTLAEAARRFEEAEETLDDGEAFVQPYRRVTGERGLSLNVLLWAAREAGGGATSLARLEGEYRQRFGKAPAGDPLRAGEQESARGADPGKSPRPRGGGEDKESSRVEDQPRGGPPSAPGR